MTPDDAIIIRRLTEYDREAVLRLAQLDSSSVPEGELLGAEIEGRLVAAISLTTGWSIADPFMRTKEIQEILRLRLAHIRRQDPALRRGQTPVSPAGSLARPAARPWPRSEG
jgi:hypothetical protein